MRNGLMQSGLTRGLTHGLAHGLAQGWTDGLTKTLTNCMMTAAAAAFLCAGSAAWAQKYTAPRAPWDNTHPDLSGIWQAKATVGDDIEKSIVARSNKKIPYLPGEAAKVKANAANKAKLDTMAKCYMPGVPRMMYM